MKIFKVKYVNIDETFVFDSLEAAIDKAMYFAYEEYYAHIEGSDTEWNENSVGSIKILSNDEVVMESRLVLFYDDEGQEGYHLMMVQTASPIRV